LSHLQDNCKVKLFLAITGAATLVPLKQCINNLPNQTCIYDYINIYHSTPDLGRSSIESPPKNLKLNYTYSRSILPFANTNVSRYILVTNISIFVKGNMGQREY
jgi:hypothetical protein